MKALGFYLAVCAVAVGCAALPPGVTMTEEDKAACAAQKPDEPCTVWTVNELTNFAKHFFMQGRAQERNSL